MAFCFILHDLSLFCPCIRFFSILAYPLWNGDVSPACLSSAFDDDNMSNIGESWKDEL